MASSTVDFASAAGTYTINQEWAQIFINQDGTIDLVYNVSITVTGGTISAFDLGQPNRDFTIGTAVDQHGNSLYTYKYTEDVASVDFTPTNNRGRNNLVDHNHQRRRHDSQRHHQPRNYGMHFIPQWDKSVE